MPDKDVCMTCHGTGILDTGSVLRPSVACSNCHGSGKYKYGSGVIREMEEKQEDMINNPPHYTFGTIEVIDVIEDWQLGFHEGNCVKYIARAKHKGDELEDLKKAQWYLNRKIKDMELESAAGDDE